ncbi:MAG TPA: hypothetical protein VHX44_07765 [Planctomycetota bacterium]|nr:hypothetical protein [Planctomycetota bacterium]
MADHRRLLSRLPERRGAEIASLEAWFAEHGQNSWNRLHDVGRNDPTLIDDEAVAIATTHAAESPGSHAALLIMLAARDEKRRKLLVDACLAHLARHPGPTLRAAGYQLHEYHCLIDARWIAAAKTHYTCDTEGAWGVLEAAAMYESEFLTADDIPWLDARRHDQPRDHAIALLSLAKHWPAQRDELIALALRALDEHPATALSGIAQTARDDAELLTPALVSAVVRHLCTTHEEAIHKPAWELLGGASTAAPAHFTDALLDQLDCATANGPGSLFTILRHLMGTEPTRMPALRTRFAALMCRHPQAGVEAAFYGFQGEAMALVDVLIVDALLAGFAAAAYPAYQFLGRLLDRRGELINESLVDVAITNIEHATNYAFGFFRTLIEDRPEFTAQATIALFECLAREPINRAHVRVEQIEVLGAIAQASHVRTGLERALRAPPRHGSRRARALLAIMFRDKRRARRHVLIEALRWAATTVLRREQSDSEGENRYAPVWDFTLFIIDHSGDDAHSTAAAKRFLEGAFQLSHLFRTGTEATGFLQRLNLLDVPPSTLPAAIAGLINDPDLITLHDLVIGLGQRFAVEPRLAPLEEFSVRADTACAELAALEQRLTATEAARRPMLEKRITALRQRLATWADPAYQRAFSSGDDAQLVVEARDLLRHERKDLSKRLRDALRAEAVRIATETVERTCLDCYRGCLYDILGREVDFTTVEPAILSVFLWFPAIANLPNNTRCLKRLVEDRLLGRQHDWLRTEPEAVAWAERVRAAQPNVRLELWRAPFSREYTYRPTDAQAEKRRRIAADLAQARVLLEQAGTKKLASGSYEELNKLHAELSAPTTTEDGKDSKDAAPRVDTAVLAEVAMNLERVRVAEQTPDSDFAGKLTLSVEDDPIEMLFMGEYGFASCLSLRGINAWSAVSNAIDIDKVIIWATEPDGNVVGRRLLALVPEGALTFRTYTNRHGLALDTMFDRFVSDYAAHCGVPLTHGVQSGPLLSDRWYDDGSL